MDEEVPVDEGELLKRLGMALRDKWNALPLYAHRQILDWASELEGWPEGMDVHKVLNDYLELHDPRDPDES
jgi:hypothetical protein